MDNMNDVVLTCLVGSAAFTGLVVYYWRKEAAYLKYVTEAPRLNLNKDLYSLVDDSPNQTIPYAIIEGPVEAVGETLKSEHATGLVGVIQTLVCKEHKTYWSRSTRLWHDTTRLIRNVTRSVPFVLKEDTTRVQVHDPSSATGLDVPIIYDSFDPSPTTLGATIVNWASGEKTKGFQTMEMMLSEGTVLTGVGMISTSTGKLMFGPPEASGRMYILSQGGLARILGDLQSTLTQFKYIIGVSGSITMIMVALWIYNWWKRYSERVAHELDVDRILRNRADSTDREDNVSLGNGEDNTCTICLTNRRDVVLLECGHVCACARCARLLQPPQCPICRQRVKRIIPLFTS